VCICTALAVGGCATPKLETIEQDVQEQVAARSSATGDAAQPIDALLSSPLDCDTAARVALLNHPRVREIQTRLRVAQSDLYDALRPSIPRWTSCS
jgi:hypothetical protein